MDVQFAASAAGIVQNKAELTELNKIELQNSAKPPSVLSQKEYDSLFGFSGRGEKPLFLFRITWESIDYACSQVIRRSLWQRESQPLLGHQSDLNLKL